ncbi:hypothetical protein MUY14_07280 [Amycolatopsis sp. FBCC-B4732]|uniref:hypothetical protein n=1 Tax=Amycolatopsis sp. FBCC-B4732 TaxID=3079339 RepID=UPI001FF3B8C4|nr:hypothetical protein [Amycolatopsis sp. FBCC-B4732]UOX90418.1 hypothetical protein MUY14_07280 [Amycolatopsis sp. FBCC-B4732]
MTTDDQSQPDFVNVLAINISSRYSERDDVRAVTAKGWKIRQRGVDAVMEKFGKVVVAVADGVIKGVFDVKTWSLDRSAGDTIVFRADPRSGMAARHRRPPVQLAAQRRPSEESQAAARPASATP